MTKARAVSPGRLPASPTNLGWSDVLASISDGVIVVDAQAVVSDLNPAAELLTGIAASQAVGRPVHAVFGGRPSLAWVAQLSANTIAQAVTHQHAEASLSTGGRETVVSAACAPVLDTEGRLQGAVLVLHDLTLLRSLEAAASRVERLSTLDTVAAGLAHEIRNPLGGIKGAAQLLRGELTDPAHLRCTSLIIREVDRLDGLVDQLGSLGSPVTLDRRPCNIHRVLTDVITLQRQTPAWGDIVVVSAFDPSLPPVLGDRAQLTQVFLNLVKNSVEALEGSGTITLATRMDSYRVRRGHSPTHLVVVTIEDSGPGVPEEDHSRLFAPFFSTKARGSGLGLAMCQRIITQHDGTLVYESPSRGGARFRATLPVSDQHDLPES